MICKAIKTKVIHARDNLFEIIIETIPSLSNRSVLAITSKVVALTEGRIVEITPKTNKDDLIKDEADVYLAESLHHFHLTIKHNILIASSGIDESNGNGYYILWPQNPFQSAQRLWEQLRSHYQINDIGILLTDSHTTPLRRGVTGICIGYYGFKGMRNHIGSPDLFGRSLKHTTINVADALAATAVFTMGEANEATPLALITDTNIEFTNTLEPREVSIALKDDLYYPLLKNLL